MRQNVQNYKGLNQNISRYGCLFFCLIQITHPDEDYTSEEINKFYKTFVENGWMELDCYVKDAISILHSMGRQSKYIQRIPVSSSIDDIQINGDVAILYCRKNGYSHFILKYRDGTTWDSLDPLRPQLKDYKVTELRYLIG